MIAFRLEDVVKEYAMGQKRVRALDQVNLTVQPGEFLGIVGRSGSGKSTLLNLLAGLDQPTSGAIWVGSQNMAEMSSQELAEHRQRTVGVVFQFFYLVSTLTALENVMLPMAFAGVSGSRRRERAQQLLHDVGLAERAEHLPSELSGGEQQRVVIARALANNPAFLLADEPTGNLDSQTGEEIMAIFQQLHDQGRTLICITHELGLIQRRATRFLELKDGRIVRGGSEAVES